METPTYRPSVNFFGLTLGNLHASINNLQFVMLKNPKGVAFGSASKRFDAKGLHPNLGLLPQNNNIPPGHYQKIEEWKAKKTPGMKWTKKEKEQIKLKVKQNINELHKQKLNTAEVIQAKILPNEEQKADPPFVHQTNCPRKHFGYLPSKRFSDLKSNTPGPGFYGKNHIPALRKEEFLRSKKIIGKWGTYEQPRFPEYSVSPEWKMTPAQYNFNHPSSLQATLDKKISKKGPYELFSGKRDETSLTGYFATSKFKGSATMFYELPSDIMRLQSAANHHIGRWCPFRTLAQKGGFRYNWVEVSRFKAKPSQRHLIDHIGFAYRDPKEPGPATYLPRIDFSYFDYGFNPPFLRREGATRGKIKYFKCHPGATRYYPEKMHYVNGHQNVFNSSLPRLRK